jgi:hypothetical protein
MAWKKLGNVILSVNEQATSENKQPFMKGSLEMTDDLKKGDKMSLSIWLNKTGTTITSGSLHLSTFEKDEEYGG